MLLCIIKNLLHRMQEETDIIRFYQRLRHQGYGITEVRAITGEGIKGIGFFDNQDDFVKACVQWNGKANLYAGRNPRNRTLLNRAPNRIISGVREGGKNEDITFITAVAIDIDPIRDKNSPSTDEEFSYAIDVAESISKDFPNSTIDLTGNGACVWMPIEPIQVPLNEDERERLRRQLQRFEADIREKYLGDEYRNKVQMDYIHDFARVNRIIGTQNIKGVETKDRPHRLARFHTDPIFLAIPGLKEKIVAIEPQGESRPHEQREVEEVIPADSALIRRATEGIPREIETLWQVGYPQDRSDGLTVLLQYFKYKRFSDDEAISLVMDADRRWGKFHTRGDSQQTITAYFKNALKKIKEYATQNTNGEIQPPYKKLAKMFNVAKINESEERGIPVNSQDNLVQTQEQESSQNVRPMSELVEALYGDIVSDKEEELPLPTFSETLNRNLNGGLQRGKVYTIVSPAGYGKTTFALQLLEEITKDNKIPCIFVAMEMSRKELFIKTLSRLAEVNSGDIEGKFFLNEGYENKNQLRPKMDEAFENYGQNYAPYLYMLEGDGDWTVHKITEDIQEIMNQYRGENEDSPRAVVCIDPFQRLSSGNRWMDYDNIKKVGKIASDLKRLARGLNIAIVLLSDTTKEATKRAEGGREMGSTAIRESYLATHTTDVLGEIMIGNNLLDKLEKDVEDRWKERYEQAKMLHPLDTEEYKSSSPTYACLKLSKQRSGSTIPALFVYQKAYNKFVPIEDEREHPEEEGVKEASEPVEA